MQIYAQILVILATRPCSPCSAPLCFPASLPFPLYHTPPLPPPSPPPCPSSASSSPSSSSSSSFSYLYSLSLLRFVAPNASSRPVRCASYSLSSCLWRFCSFNDNRSSAFGVWLHPRETWSASEAKGRRVRGYKAGLARSLKDRVRRPPTTTRLYRGEKGCSTSTFCNHEASIPYHPSCCLYLSLPFFVFLHFSLVCRLTAPSTFFPLVF